MMVESYLKTMDCQSMVVLIYVICLAELEAISGEFFCLHERQAVLTTMILSLRTDRPGQTVQTQIRLLLEEQSDQGLHCLPFRLHRLDSLVYGKAT